MSVKNPRPDVPEEEMTPQQRRWRQIKNGATFRELRMIRRMMYQEPYPQKVAEPRSISAKQAKDSTRRKRAAATRLAMRKL